MLYSKRSEKAHALEQIKGLFADKPLFLIGFKNLTVAEFSKFRKDLAAIGVECHVVKNSLISQAAQSLGYKDLAAQKISLATAVVSGNGDPVAMAKAIKTLIAETLDADKKARVTVKCGMVEGQFLSAADVVELAELPPREALLGQLLGLLQAPASQLVRVLNAKLSSVVYVLNAFLEKKKEQTA